MRVLLDDHLSLLVRLDALDLPEDVESPTLTTSAFDVRLASAIAAPRRTEGVLQRLFAAYGAGRAPEDVFAPAGTIEVVDPRAVVVETARAKVELGCQLLPAEVVAAARSTGAVVRLVEANASGTLLETVRRAGLDVTAWRLEERDGRFGVTAA